MDFERWDSCAPLALGRLRFGRRSVETGNRTRRAEERILQLAAGVWGAEIRFSCREAVFVDQSAESISSLDAV
jgi:hypothetical protein